MSYLLNPLCLPPLGIVLFLLHFKAPQKETWVVGLLSILFFCILPFFFILWMLRKGHTDTIEIRDREDRPRALKASLVFSLIGGGLMIWQGKTVQALLLAMISAQILTTILSQMITHYWKISLHLTGISGFLGGMFYTVTHLWRPETSHVIQEDWVFLALICIPILMWSRMKVKAHTFGQVFAGTLLGFGTTYILFWLFNSYIYDLHP